MNLKNKAMKNALALTVGTVMMSVIASTANTEPEEKLVISKRTVEVEENTNEGMRRTAGVVFSLNELEESTLAKIHTVEFEQVENVVVTSAGDEEEVVSEDSIVIEEESWENRLMADVEEQMNIRAEASADSELVGRFRKGDVAEIIEVVGEWTHIKSGNVEGYVKNEYCVSGSEALEYAKENIDTRATVTGSGVRVRSEANTDSSIISAVSEGTVLMVETNTETNDEWVAVQYTGETRYVSAEFVEVELATTQAITIEEEREIERKKAEEEAKRKSAQTTDVTVVQKSSMSASTDETLLLAALIQCEAGGESYEGKLAVGAVVMNRVRSGRYPNSISEVIYASGQFTPAGNGKVASVLSSGPKDSCIQAAQEAINGIDNTGGALRFKGTRSGQPGVVIGNHVFY